MDLALNTTDAAVQSAEVMAVMSQAEMEEALARANQERAAEHSFVELACAISHA